MSDGDHIILNSEVIQVRRDIVLFLPLIVHPSLSLGLSMLN